jgi:hypothetical protein
LALGETAAIGRVSETKVRLQRVIPMMSNSFKPSLGRLYSKIPEPSFVIA